MITILARAVARWMAMHPGEWPEIRSLRSRSIEPGGRAEVRSDPLGLFAPDVFVVARAAEDFVVSEICSTPTGVVVVVANVSRTLMPRRFDGWLIGRASLSNSTGRVRRSAI